MYRRVLVPVDLSGEHRETLEAVRGLADPRQTSITLLHVVELLRDVPFEEMEDFYAELRERAQTKLVSWVEQLAGQGYEAGKEIVFGRRAEEIIRFAEERTIDLIALRSQALDHENPAATFGSLSHQISLLAGCSVLLVR